MENMTIEELIALGLSEEEAKAIVGVSDGANTGGLPFPLMKISYDDDFAKKGNFITDIRKEDATAISATDLGNTIEIRVIGDLAQYSYYNETTGKVEVLSNVFHAKNSKRAIDLYSGMLISDLKATNEKIKYNQVVAALVRSAGSKDNFTPVIFYVKGSFLYDFNSCRQKLDNNGNVSFVMTIKTKKQKRGAVTYFTLDTDAFAYDKLPQKEVLASIKEVASIAKAYKDWTELINNKQGASKPIASEGEVDEDVPLF